MGAVCITSLCFSLLLCRLLNVQWSCTWTFTYIFILMQHTIYTETPAVFNENIWVFSITIWNNRRLLLLRKLSLYSMFCTWHQKINFIKLQTQKDYLHIWGQFMYHRFWTSNFLTPAAAFVWAVEQFVAIGCLEKFGAG